MYLIALFIRIICSLYVPYRFVYSNNFFSLCTLSKHFNVYVFMHIFARINLYIINL